MIRFDSLTSVFLVLVSNLIFYNVIGGEEDAMLYVEPSSHCSLATYFKSTNFVAKFEFI